MSGREPSTRRGPREDRDRLRTEQLLDAALEAFGTAGFAASTIEDICATARVGTRSFYRYFASKEDLLKGVYDRQIAAVGSALTQALSCHPNQLVDRVRAGVRAFVETTTADERAARVQLLEIVGVNASLEAHRRGVLRAFAVLIEQEYTDLNQRGLITGLITRQVLPVVCMALVGGANEVLVDWMHAVSRPDKRTIIDGLVQLHLNAAR